MKKILYRILLYFMVAVILIWILAPYTWLIISSLSTKVELISVPLRWIPKKINLEGYKQILLGGESAARTARDFKEGALNSLLVATFVTLICMSAGSLAAFSFSRFRSKLSNMSFLFILLSYMLPPISIAIPIYIMLSRLHILDNIGSLVFVYCSFNLPIAVLFMKEFFDSIPVDLEEAAQIDGCSRLKTLWKIVVPLSTPGLASTAIFIFVVSWNEFFFALLYTSTLASKTLPVLVGEFSSKIGVDYVMMSTAGILASIPPVIMALVFQKYIVQGLTAGAVKG